MTTVFYVCVPPSSVCSLLLESHSGALSRLQLRNAPSKRLLLYSVTLKTQHSKKVPQSSHFHKYFDKIESNRKINHFLTQYKCFWSIIMRNSPLKTYESHTGRKTKVTRVFTGYCLLRNGCGRCLQQGRLGSVVAWSWPTSGRGTVVSGSTSAQGPDSDLLQFVDVVPWGCATPDRPRHMQFAPSQLKTG